MNQYLAAVLAHDPKGLPLSADVKYVVILPKGEEEDVKNYDKAVLFGTTFLREDELLDFIGK